MVRESERVLRGALEHLAADAEAQQTYASDRYMLDEPEWAAVRKLAADALAVLE